MARPAHVPDSLRERVFTTSEAAAAGVISSMLRGDHFVQVHRGVWRLAQTELTFELGVRAASLALPPSAALSHVSALRWMGVVAGRPFPIHFSVHGSHQTRAGLLLHRRAGRISPRVIRGVPTLGPDRSFVDSATVLGLSDLVRTGDALVRAGLTSVDVLVDYVVDCRRLDHHRRHPGRLRSSDVRRRPHVRGPGETGLPRPTTRPGPAVAPHRPQSVTPTTSSTLIDAVGVTLRVGGVGG